MVSDRKKWRKKQVFENKQLTLLTLRDSCGGANDTEEKAKHMMMISICTTTSIWMVRLPSDESTFRIIGTNRAHLYSLSADYFVKRGSSSSKSKGGKKYSSKSSKVGAAEQDSLCLQGVSYIVLSIIQSMAKGRAKEKAKG